MGTSQAVNPGVKGEPNWGKLSRQLSYASKHETISNKNLEKIMSSFVNVAGGSKKIGTGRSKVFGSAGRRTLNNFFGIYSSENVTILKEELATKGINLKENPTVDEIKKSLYQYCSEESSNLDETASNAALQKLLEEIFEEINSTDDFDESLDRFNREQSDDYILFFMTEYIVEFSDELFGERIFNKQGANRKRTFKQIRDYIKKMLETDYHRKDLNRVDWKGEDGERIITEIQTEILEVFEK